MDYWGGGGGELDSKDSDQPTYLHCLVNIFSIYINNLLIPRNRLQSAVFQANIKC